MLRKAVAGSYRKLVAGDPWKRQKERYGIGFIRALEVTHGDNGWHPHLHVLFFLDRAKDLDALGDWMFARWQKIVKRMGFGTPSGNAWDWKLAVSPEGAAEYITKIASELTHAHMKEGRNGGRSPFQILSDYAALRNNRDAELFRDFAKSFKGARQLTYSRDLRDRYKVDVMDDADAAVEPEYDSKTVAFMTGETFEELAARELDMALLILVDNAPSWETVVQFLRRHRLEGGAGPPYIDAAIKVND